MLGAAITQLLSMGMSTASHVLLTGVDHAGTSAILTADTVAAMLPSTVTLKVLGVDALHPQARPTELTGTFRPPVIPSL